MDQYYTKDHVAEKCWEYMVDTLASLNKNVKDFYFIEPSAGEGSFYNLIPTLNKIGFDILPKHEEVIEQDFLSYLDFHSLNKPIITIGNPPFGKKGKLAISFINHAAIFSDLIAFIVPAGLNKWSAQKQIDPSFKLIRKFEIEANAFYLLDGKDYDIRTEFQIWTIWQSKKYKDLRTNKRNPLNHKDFQIWQYNVTSRALKVFQNKFDFAIPCQGWQDYSRRETNKEKCEKSKQWILVCSSSEEVLKRLDSIDYAELAYRGMTVIPGFTKTDVIAEYNRLYST